MTPSTPSTPLAQREGQPSPTQAGSLDLSDRKDRGLLRTSIKLTWAIPDDFKAECVAAMRVAVVKAREEGDVKGINDCVRTVAMMTGQDQTDIHAMDKNARLDAGEATENVVSGVRMIVVGPRRGAE
jgi:hypothetical protein